MLTEKQKRHLAQYEKDLAIPAWKYVLIYGLTFSVLYIIFSWASDYMLEETTFPEIFITKPLRYLIVFSFGTISFGLLMRLLVWMQYKSLKSKEAA